MIYTLILLRIGFVTKMSTSSEIDPTGTPHRVTNTDFKSICGQNLFYASDIQIFIATYDRPAYLKLSIESVLGQTAGGFEITVLDNGTNPDTEKTVEAFSQHKVHYRTSRHLGKHGNLLLAQVLASNAYVMVFHDDDQMHPDYIRNVLAAINATPNITLVTGRMTATPAGTRKPFDVPIAPVGHLFDQHDYATFRYDSGSVFLPITVYKTTLFKKLDLSSLFEAYGKWGDTVLIIDAIDKGLAAVFSASCGWYGVHSGQDSADLNTLPSFAAWLAIESRFLSILGDNPKTFSGLSFCMMNRRHLASGFKRRIKRNVTCDEYYQRAWERSSITDCSHRFRFVSNHLTQKIFLLIVKFIYRKRERVLYE